MSDTEATTAAQVRLVATDLDGTLLRDDRTVSARTRQTLANATAAGVKLVLVTARPPRFVHALATDLGLTGVTICCNGSIVYDIAEGVMLEHLPISPADANDLVVRLREAAPGIAFAVESGLTYGCEPAYLALGAPSQPQDEMLADAETLCERPITKLIARHPQLAAEDLQSLALQIAGERASFTYSSVRYLEASAYGVTKASTLARYCASLGVAPAEVVAFGDMPNDAAMLRWAGRGVAVANAHAEARAAAAQVTASNMDDGVALALERLLDL